MGIFNYLLHNREAETKGSAISIDWDRIKEFKESHIERKYYSNWRDEYIMCASFMSGTLVPPVKDPLAMLNAPGANQFILIGSNEDFTILKEMCENFAPKLEQLIKLYRKMDCYLPSNIQTIAKEYNDLIVSLSYSYKYIEK